MPLLDFTQQQCWGVRAESRGAEIKLSPGAGAGAEITNCGSGSSSGSFLFIKEKIMAAEEFFVNCYNFNPIRVKYASIYVKK